MVRLSARAGFWSVAASFAVVMSFMTVPTPLYGLYAQRDGFGAFTLTLIFAAYGAGVMLGLYLLGHLSDHVGRRLPFLLVAAAEVLVAIAFAAWESTPGLIALRFVSGIGVGAISASATAWLGELWQAARPGTPPHFASTVATAVNTGGLAIGPLVAGLISEVAHPLVLPYGVYAVLLALVLVGVWRAPETVPDETRAKAYRYRPQRVGVEPAARKPFAAAAVAALAGFSVLGFVTALTGRFLVDTLDITSRVTIGLVVTVIVGASPAAQVLLARLPERLRLRIGAALVAVGVVGMAAAGLAASLALYLVGGIVAVAGVGLVFQATIATAARLASPDRRGETLAALFLAAYLGITAPVIAIGAALLAFGTVPVLVVFAAIVFLTVPAGILQLERQS